MVNRARKSQIKTEIKRFETAIEQENLETARAEFHAAVKKLDTVASTGTMHKRTAARKKSRLAKKLNKLAAGKTS